MFKMKHDKEAKALYIYASKKKIERTQELSNNCLLDMDKDGNIVGVEILGAEKAPKKNEVKVVIDTVLSK